MENETSEVLTPDTTGTDVDPEIAALRAIVAAMEDDQTHHGPDRCRAAQRNGGTTMSVRIGEMMAGKRLLGRVSASRGGVELKVEAETLTPIEARNYAALLVRAADEAERMRRVDPEATQDERAGYAKGKRDAIATVAHWSIDAGLDIRAPRLTLLEVMKSLEALDFNYSAALAPPPYGERE